MTHHTPLPDMHNWPPEVQQAYEEISIPTEYDMLLAYEKLACEVRRQNKELCALHHSLAKTEEHIVDALQMQFQSPPSTQGVSYDEIFISLIDALSNLFTQAQTTCDEVEKSLPQNRFAALLSNQRWQKHLFAILDSLYEAINIVKCKGLSVLAEIGIECITPKAGDEFCSALHRVIETCPGTQNGKIAQLLRYGYQKQGIVLRPADVIVTVSKKEGKNE